VRYSEKILERSGFSRDGGPLGNSWPSGPNEGWRRGGAGETYRDQEYVEVQNIPDAALLKMAKLGAVIDGWMRETEVTISAIQCWTALEDILA